MKQAEVKAKSEAVLKQKSQTFVFSTVDAKGRPRSRFMGGVVPVEGKPFDLYLVTGAESRKVQQLSKNPNAQILIARPDWSEIVTLSGKARVVASKTLKKIVWDGMPGAQKYFKGLDDPDFGVILFKGKELEYLSMQASMTPKVVRL